MSESNNFSNTQIKNNSQKILTIAHRESLFYLMFRSGYNKFILICDGIKQRNDNPIIYQIPHLSVNHQKKSKKRDDHQKLSYQHKHSRFPFLKQRKSLQLNTREEKTIIEEMQYGIEKLI